MPNFLQKDFKLVEKSKIWFAIPAVILVIGIVLLIVFGFNLGIEFAGGTQLNIEVSGLTAENFQEASNEATAALTDLGIEVSNVQKETLAGTMFIKMSFKNQINHTAVEGEKAEAVLTSLERLYSGSELSATDKENLSAYLGEDFDYTAYRGISARIHGVSGLEGAAVTMNRESTGPAVSQQLFTNALLSLGIALAFILAYIIVRFRSLGGFAAGLAAVLALLHDVLIMLSFMVVFGLLGMQMNSTFVAAVITIVCYSINNTIVVFDRVRENQKLMGGDTVQAIANISVKQVLGRTLFTSLTTLIAVLVLTILGVSTLREFTAPIIVGLIAGTYSSVFLAAPLWALMKMKGDKNQPKKAAPKKKAPQNDKVVV